jgi:hypothetical protein
MLNPTLSQSASRRSSGFSRRDLLKGLTASFGGAIAVSFFAPRASGAPVTPALSSSPAILLTGNLTNGNQVIATGLASYGPGWIFVLTQNTSGSSTTYDLEFVDVHSLNTVFSFVNFYNRALPTTPFLPPVCDDTFVYTANGNTVYCIPLANPMLYTVTFTVGASVTGNLVLAGDTLLVATSDGSLHAYMAKTRVPLWSISLGSSISDVTTFGNTVYVSAGGNLSAYSLSDQSNLFTVTAATGKLTATSDSVYVTATDGVHSYNSMNGLANWRYAFTGSANFSATPYNGFLYALDNSGNLHEIQPAPTQGGANRPPLPLSPDVDYTQQLVFEDGVVYGASTGGTANLTIYPMILASGDISAYPTNLPGRFLGVENGTCFFTHDNGGSVAGVALNPQVNGFYAESELMADDYPGGNVKAQGTSFRTQVRLLDANNNPRPNKAVKVWASDQVTLTIESTSPNGTSTQVTLAGGPSSAQWLTTDSSGEISIVCTAANINCPAIFMWGSFMYQVNGEYMVLYPDHGTLNSLSTKSADDLSTGTSYDPSSPLLQSQYQGNASDIATHIQNTLNGVSSTSVSVAASHVPVAAPAPPPGHRQPINLQANPNKYVAYPGAAPNLLSGVNYSQNAAASYRKFAPSTANYPTGYSFNLSSSVSIEQQLLGRSLGSFLDMVKNVVVNAVQKVTSVVVNVVNNVITHIISVAEGVYSFVVDTVEAAAASVAAVLATIAKDIKSAVEWLSYLFAWDDMVANANTISNQIQTNMTSFVTSINNGSSSAQTYINTVLGAVTTDITNAFGGIIADIGGSSLESQQPNGNNQQQVYGGSNSQSYTKSQWMTSKVKSNVNGASSTSVSLSAQLGASPAVDKLLQAGENFLQTVVGKLKADTTNLPGNLHDQLSKFSSNCLQDPSSFVKNAVTLLLTILEDAAILALDFVGAVLDAFISSLADLLSGALDLLTQAINIPVITTLWNVITSSQPSFELSILNLISLVLAIPATIIVKAVGGQQDQLEDGNNGEFGKSLLVTGQVIAGLIYAGFDAYSDYSNQNADSGVALALIGLTSCTFLLGIPQPFPQNDANSYLWWAGSALPLVYGCYMYAANKWKFGSFAIANAQGGSTNGLYGTAMLGFSGMLCSKDPEHFKGTDYLSLLQNLFTYLPYLGKAFAGGPAGSPSRIGVAIVDGVGDITGTILEIIPH